MTNSKKLNILRSEIYKLYQTHSQILLFHWWHHIDFVVKKSIIFGKSIDANLFLVESAALVHDLNYIIEINSEPEIAAEYRAQLLHDYWYTKDEIHQIESIISEAHTGTRWKLISEEGKALSDADTLFKALPITPILFANNYIKQNQIDIEKLASKITKDQKLLLSSWIYFYTEIASSNYLHRARVNLMLRENIEDCLKDWDVKEMLMIAYNSKVI